METVEEIVQEYLTRMEQAESQGDLASVRYDVAQSKLGRVDKTYLFNEANFRLNYLNNGRRGG